jgi:type VI secretion system protein ImpG
VADSTGVKTSPIMNELLAQGHAFSFVQVMRLARKFLGPNGTEELPEIPWQSRVQIRPELSLAFPAGDVARVERDGDNLRVTTTFLELYGPASPLPNFYSEDLLDEASCDESVFRDFLDIIHQRLYHLYFQCWSKYRLFIRVVEENNPVDRERLFCLIGLGEKELRDTLPDSWSLLRYTGILTQFPRSALGLATILRDALKEKRIRIIQNVKRMVPIPKDQRMRMGMSGCCLGVDTVLGSEIADRMGKCLIEIGPLTWEAYNDFLPGTLKNEKLASLVRFYLTDPLEVELKLILAAGEAKPIVLGDPAARLGLNTWCFSGDTLGEVSAGFQVSATPFKRTIPTVSESTPSPTDSNRSMIDYYREERAQLGDLAADFVQKHPNLASLVSGPMADPGVERLLEGTAFYNALLQQKLEDDIPEFIHEVIHSLQPEHLRPVPATTIVAFTPKPNLTEPQLIPKGTELKSVAVEGTQCRFTTSWPVEIHPLALNNASFTQPPGRPAAITLSLELAGIALSNWKVTSLRLFLAGEYKNASNLYLALMRNVKRIVIRPQENGGQPITLAASHLKPVGFDDADLLFPSTSASASLQFLREYFTQPDKFLFLDLTGFDTWRGRGDGTGFEIRFELDKLPFELHKVSVADFVLFASPAMNVFKHRSKTIVTDSKCSEYQVSPAVRAHKHYNIYSIEAVSAFLNYTKQKISLASGHHENPQSGTEPIYHVKRRNAHITNGIDTFISIETHQESFSFPLTSLVAELKCTNGNLPEKLLIGDICKTTDSSPNFCEFTNCKPVTRPASIDTRNNTLWRLYSLCNLNISQLNVRSLQAALEVVAQSYNRNYTPAKLNSKRIQGITDFQIKAIDRLLGRYIVRGWEIKIKLHQEAYSSPGDLYVFGSLLEYFLRAFASQSCFTQTIIVDDQTENTYEWPAQMGRRNLV